MRNIGTDIVKVDRYKFVNKKFLEDCFSVNELKECNSNPICLAGKWAAKESYMKCVEETYSYIDVEVLRTKKGAPYLVINGVKSKHLVSISHTAVYATAVVFIEE